MLCSPGLRRIIGCMCMVSWRNANITARVVPHAVLQINEEIFTLRCSVSSVFSHTRPQTTDTKKRCKSHRRLRSRATLERPWGAFTKFRESWGLREDHCLTPTPNPKLLNQDEPRLEGKSFLRSAPKLLLD